MAGLSWRSLDGEWLLHDAGAGCTHVLDSVSAAVLGRIESGPVDEADLRVWLAQLLETPDDEALATALRQVLGNLAAIDLIEAVLP